MDPAFLLGLVWYAATGYRGISQEIRNIGSSGVGIDRILLSILCIYVDFCRRHTRDFAHSSEPNFSIKRYSFLENLWTFPINHCATFDPCRVTIFDLGKLRRDAWSRLGQRQFVFGKSDRFLIARHNPFHFRKMGRQPFPPWFMDWSHIVRGNHFVDSLFLRNGSKEKRTKLDLVSPDNRDCLRGNFSYGNRFTLEWTACHRFSAPIFAKYTAKRIYQNLSAGIDSI